MAQHREANRPTPEQQKAPEGPIRKLEYKNARGEKICDVEIRMSEVSEALPGKPDLIGRKLEAYVLTKVVDGKQVTVDLMEIAGAKQLGAEAFFVENKKDVAFNDEKEGKKYIAMSSLESPLDAVTFLHEFGHTAQNQDPRFEGIKQNYSLGRWVDSAPNLISYDRIKQSLDAIDLKLTPEQQSALDAYKTLDKGAFDLLVDESVGQKKLAELKQATGGDLQQRVNDLKALETKLDTLKGQIAAGAEQRKQLLKTLEPIVSLPMRMMERDATARAFVNARKVKKMGINLFEPVTVSKDELSPMQKGYYEAFGTQKDCGSSVKNVFSRMWSKLTGDKTIETSARKDMGEFALWSYDATMGKMREAYGGAPRPKADLPPDEAVLEELDIVEEPEPVRAVPPPPPVARRSPPPPPVRRAA
jgi:hypothetical protein